MPSPELERNWPAIRRLFATSLGFVVASINSDGSPHLTPIGSICLRHDCTAYYLEHFPTRLPANIERDPRICVYAGKAGFLAWMMALARGRFTSLPAVRLIGRAGERRPSTVEERERFLRKVRIFRLTRGHDMLWGRLDHARELIFDDMVPVRAGAMTRGPWLEKSS